MRGKTSVLIVDDSALVRQLLSDIISRDPQLEVAGIAGNGIEAVRLTKELEPDVITMDIHMPEMDGLTALEYIMKRAPRPVVMLSVLAREGAAPTLRSLELGAADYICKPSQYPMSVAEVKDEVLEKIKTAAHSRARETWEQRKRVRPSRRVRPRKGEVRGGQIVVIGASAGGPLALLELIPALPARLPAHVVIVQHMPAAFTGSFAGRLNDKSRMEVREARHGEVLHEGGALLAPGGVDLAFERGDDGQVRAVLRGTVARRGACPVIDVTMESAAGIFGGRTVGVLLSGMGTDGVLGFGTIKDAGGRTIAQDEDTSLVYGMPRVAAEKNLADLVLPLEEIAAAVVSMI